MLSSYPSQPTAVCGPNDQRAVATTSHLVCWAQQERHRLHGSRAVGWAKIEINTYLEADERVELGMAGSAGLGDVARAIRIWHAGLWGIGGRRAGEGEHE